MGNEQNYWAKAVEGLLLHCKNWNLTPIFLDMQATRKLLVAPVERSYALRDGVEVMHPGQIVVELERVD